MQNNKFSPNVPWKTKKILMWFININMMIALFDVKRKHVLMWIQKLFHKFQALKFYSLFVGMLINITQIE